MSSFQFLFVHSPVLGELLYEHLSENSLPDSSYEIANRALPISDSFFSTR